MSRLLVALSLSLTFPFSSLVAQSLPDEQIAAQIERSRRLVAVDNEGCVKYPVNDDIVVCGANKENERQKLEPEPYDANRLRRGDAVSSERAAGCVQGDNLCRTPPSGGTPFGSVPPPALDYYELMKGLPEPDMIIPEPEMP
jgi:hypothetical protein